MDVPAPPGGPTSDRPVAADRPLPHLGTAPWSSQEQATKADITIVGLGPGSLQAMSLGVWHALHQATCLYVRTERHPCLAHLSGVIAWQSFDYLYDAGANFEQIYAQIAQQVIGTALSPGQESGRLVYAVPGHPWVGEQTTRLILSEAAAQGLTVQILGSGSFVESAFAAVGVDLMDGGQIMDAMILARQHHPQVEVSLPLLVGQLFSPYLASDVKLTLLNAYPPEHRVTLVHAAGLPEEHLRALPLHELDHGSDFDHLTSLYVPALPHPSSIRDLQEIAAHLRAPEGCPWDQEQTILSLRSSLLNECYELLEAIDAEDDPHTLEEVGDVLLLAVMVVQIATEEGRFQMGDVIRRVVRKLIRRHPHVFGEVNVESMDDLLANWEAIKAEERAEQGVTAAGPLDGVPEALPALERARALQAKARKAGLLDRGALAQSIPALAPLLPPESDAATLGALLWALVALAHERDLNSENALRTYSGRFLRRLSKKSPPPAGSTGHHGKMPP